MRVAKTIQERQDVTDFVDRIVSTFHPKKVILFGSYAKGTAHASSDVDLLVVMPQVDPGFRTPIAILKATCPKFAVDLVVRTPEQITERVAAGDFFLRDILAEGKVLYESSN